MAGSGLNGETRICAQQAYMAKEMRGGSPAQASGISDLCHNIFKTVAQTKDDTEAGKRIHGLVWNAKGDEQLEKLLTPAFVVRS